MVNAQYRKEWQKNKGKSWNKSKEHQIDLQTIKNNRKSKREGRIKRTAK
jgi:hypothetical protein